MVGKTKPDVWVPVQTRGRVYDIKRDGAFISHIEITVNVQDQNEWPTMRASTQPGIKADLRVPKTQPSAIQQELRTIQELLSVFAFGRIQLEHPEVEWLPDSELEAKLLSVSRYTMKELPYQMNKLHH